MKHLGAFGHVDKTAVSSCYDRYAMSAEIFFCFITDLPTYTQTIEFAD